MPTTTFPQAGHAPGHLRDAFLVSIEAGTPNAALAGHLWNCTDILPRDACDDLGISPDSTYAQAARQVRRG